MQIKASHVLQNKLRRLTFTLTGLAPDVPLYLEMTHTSMTGRALGGSGTQPYCRTVDEQFYTTAHLARQQGATGVSLFNFVYYRHHKSEELGPFNEPPFHVLPRLKTCRLPVVYGRVPVGDPVTPLTTAPRK